MSDGYQIDGKAVGLARQEQKEEQKEQPTSLVQIDAVTKWFGNKCAYQSLVVSKIKSGKAIHDTP